MANSTQPTNLLDRYNNGEGSLLDSGTTITSAGPSQPLSAPGIIKVNNTFHDGTYNEFPENLIGGVTSNNVGARSTDDTGNA